jgi:tetratricopeptide (TPR) repeat protein
MSKNYKNDENQVSSDIENWNMTDVLSLVEEIILENLSLERKIDLWGQVLFSMNRLKPGDPVIQDWGTDAFLSARKLLTDRLEQLNLSPGIANNPILAIHNLYDPGSQLYKTHTLEAFRVSQIFYYFSLTNLDKASDEDMDGVILITIGIGSSAVRFANASRRFYECISMAFNIYELFKKVNVDRLLTLYLEELDINPGGLMYYVCHYAAEAAISMKRFPDALEWSVRGEPFVASLPHAYEKSNFYAHRGEILIELGRAEEALEWYEKGTHVPGLTPQELNDAKRNLEMARYTIQGDFEKAIEFAFSGFLAEEDRKSFAQVMNSAMTGSNREVIDPGLFDLFRKLISDSAMESFAQHTALNVRSSLDEFRQLFILTYLRGELSNNNISQVESILPEIRQLTESDLSIGLDAEIFLLQYREQKGEVISWEAISPLLSKITGIAGSEIDYYLFYLFPFLMDLGVEGLQKAAPIIASLIKKIDFTDDDRRTPFAEIQQTAMGMDNTEVLLTLLVEIAGSVPEQSDWWLANVSRLKSLSSYRGQRMQKESILSRYSSQLPPDTVKRIEELTVSLTADSLKQRGIQTPGAKHEEKKLRTLLYPLYNRDWKKNEIQSSSPVYPEITHIEMATFQRTEKNQAPVISVVYSNKIWNRYFSEEAIDDDKARMYMEFLVKKIPLDALYECVNVGMMLKDALLPIPFDFGVPPFLGVRSTGIYHNIPLDCLPLSEDEAANEKANRISDLRIEFLNTLQQIFSQSQPQSQPDVEETGEMPHWVGESMTSILLTGANSDLAILEKQLSIKKIAVFANSSFNGRFGFNPLPGVNNEAEAIGGIFQDSSVFLSVHRETESNRENFLKLSGSNAPQILHIATHGISHKKYPSGSFIVLSNKDNKRNDILGAVGYHDIMLMDLRQCDLVILSACSTHEGEGILGEGIMGLAWAFKAAGAKAVIGTRWRVSDEAAVEFWGKFYRYLLANVPIGRAFHNARLNLINQKKFNHPFYWGVFQLIV